MDAYIIGGYRSAVAKAPRGGFRFLRADDLGEQVIRRLMSDFPQLDKERIDDVIVGNATPEAEQGLNLGTHGVAHGPRHGESAWHDGQPLLRKWP